MARSSGSGSRLTQRGSIGDSPAAAGQRARRSSCSRCRPPGAATRSRSAPTATARGQPSSSASSLANLRVLPLAASLERAVTDSAELLLAVGAVLAIAYALLRTRIGVLRWPLIAAALVALGAGTALGGWAWHEKRPRDVLGSPTEEFSSTLRTDTVPIKKKKGKKPKTGRLFEEQWPTYGYDMQRTHLAPSGWRRLRPPFHGLWKLKARADIEFPPSVAYGKVYVAQQKGRFFALNA